MGQIQKLYQKIMNDVHAGINKNQHELLKDRDFDFLGNFLISKPFMESRESSGVVECIVFKDLSGIERLLLFIREYRFKKDYQKGVEKFLNKAQPFYTIETKKLSSSFSENGKKVSLLAYLINKEGVQISSYNQCS